jgi:hypothetical protein
VQRVQLWVPIETGREQVEVVPAYRAKIDRTRTYVTRGRKKGKAKKREEAAVNETGRWCGGGHM